MVSELSWIVGEPPEAPKRYWEENYSAMKRREENLAIIAAAGYVTPSAAWWENYYGRTEERARELLVKYADDAAGVASLRKWIDGFEMFRRYSDSYGYVFYVMRKPG